MRHICERVLYENPLAKERVLVYQSAYLVYEAPQTQNHGDRREPAFLVYEKQMHVCIHAGDRRVRGRGLQPAPSRENRASWYISLYFSYMNPRSYTMSPIWTQNACIYTPAGGRRGGGRALQSAGSRGREGSRVSACIARI